ncbi:DUF1275 family protein [Clostridium polyendosporum]|uniref:DUF1275 family protein n=1 Tax=Clostridium polyendosporum TaxID=69208 RepID=A0A919S2E9_9CLOT|nr:YoaK family protein [Clostridium polyendosporum]GIM29995.1 DUF1275 family protein [Clostridium polyendosporum]
MITKDIDAVQKSKIKIHLPSITSESILLGILLAIVGGLLDAYTFIERGGVFANAQTGNIVLVGIEAFKGNWGQALMESLPIFAFIIGVIVAEAIKKDSSILFIPNSKRAVLVLEIGILFIVGFIPNTISNTLVNVAISFVASLQFSSFNKLVDSPYATTMCTGNLRSASQAAYVAFTKKDRKAAIKAVCYFIIIFSFLLGAFLGGLLTFSIGTQAVWGAAILLVFSLILLHIDERKAD